MITLYTSIGRYRMISGNNDSSYPVITANGNEHRLDMKELLIWSSLMWNILTFGELRDLFLEKENELQLSDEQDFERYLKRLVFRGLIVSGSGYTGLDALSDLLNHLYLKPVTCSLVSRVSAFFRLLRNQPLCMALSVFKKDRLSHGERNVLKASREYRLSASELIQYLGDGTTGSSSEMNSEERITILTDIANLYLKRLIIFDCL